jgi:stearoyl-CoA desaturase (delta-9 desaturase)
MKSKLTTPGASPALAPEKVPEPLPLTINWIHFPLLTITPFVALYALLYVQPHPYSLALAGVFYFLTVISITGGYHRLYAHKSYDAALPLQLFYALFGAAAVQGSIRWWSRGHRAHHRYTDTDKDPYNSKRGLWWAHMGWMLFHTPTQPIGYADMRDLDSDPIVQWQHKHYPLMALMTSIVLPTAIGALWGDATGAYFYAGIVRLVICHHATFCVNSLAHYLGEHNYEDTQTPRDHFITALVTMGEGYHNFHHTFPKDYRNAVRWWQYDPTKWVIWTLSLVGLATKLKRFPENEVRKGRVLMSEKRIQETKATLDWGASHDTLPLMSMAEFKQESNAGKMWCIIDGVVYDFDSFIGDHPGGEALIVSARGRDVTKDFNGGVHLHRKAARYLLETFAIAQLDG